MRNALPVEQSAVCFSLDLKAGGPEWQPVV